MDEDDEFGLVSEPLEDEPMDPRWSMTFVDFFAIREGQHMPHWICTTDDDGIPLWRLDSQMRDPRHMVPGGLAGWRRLKWFERQEASRQVTTLWKIWRRMEQQRNAMSPRDREVRACLEGVIDVILNEDIPLIDFAP